MANENVEFNEVRCNKLLLGNEETGFFQLSVNSKEGNPVLEITPDDKTDSGKIIIQFQDGIPTLTLDNKDIGDGSSSKIMLSFSDDGHALLFIVKAHDNNMRSFATLGVNPNDTSYLYLVNNKSKGSEILMQADDSKGAIVALTSTVKREKTEKDNATRWGIVMMHTPQESVINVEGKQEIRASQKDTTEDSEE